METTIRTATLDELASLLTDLNTRKLDVVAPADRIQADHNGGLWLEGTEAVLSDDGVTSANGWYRVTETALEGLAEKLVIPRAYLRRIHAERGDLFAANVNGWLHGQVDPDGDFQVAGPDPRSFLLRCYRSDDGDGHGICRAVLSNGYRFIDHLDVLTAALTGVRDSGVDVEVRQCDLSERRMYVKIDAPAVAAAAPALLARYRSPFTGETGADNPLVSAGFILTNSETGDGAMSLTPQITVKICSNGMTMTKDVMRNVHLGGRLEHGVVQFSDETQQRSLRLVESQARDAVATFLDAGYVERKIIELEERAEVQLSDPSAAVEDVTKRLSYSDVQRNDVLRRFIEGGDTTAGGVMHAVTAAAQDQANPDVAYAMEADALPALELAAAGGY